MTTRFTIKPGKISIVLRSYNRCQFLKSAVDSIKHQTYRNYEVIAVDDGSSDGSINFLESCGDVLLIRQEREGRTRALNRGVDKASGEYTAFLDDDDLWKPRYLERVVDRFRAGRNTGAVHTDFSYFYNNAPSEHYIPVKRVRRDNIESLLTANFITPSAMVVKSEPLKRQGGFDDSLNTHEDWDMWIRLALDGVVFESLPENLVSVRWHGGNITANRVEMFSGALSVIEKNMKSVPPSYLKTAVSTRKRLANILGVVQVLAGEKRRGLFSLLSGAVRGNCLAPLYFLLALLPRTCINGLARWYGEREVIRGK